MGILGWAGDVDGRSRGLVLTGAGPRRRDVLHQVALPSFRAYADRWGYDLHAADLPVDTAATAAIGLLRRALREHRVVVWLDPDVLLLRDDEDVAALLRPRSFQGLGRGGAEPGVWVLRSCPAAASFLDTGAVLSTLDEDGPDRCYARGTTWLPERWQPTADHAGAPCAVRLADAARPVPALAG